MAGGRGEGKRHLGRRLKGRRSWHEWMMHGLQGEEPPYTKAQGRKDPDVFEELTTNDLIQPEQKNDKSCGQISKLFISKYGSWISSSGPLEVNNTSESSKC